MDVLLPIANFFGLYSMDKQKINCKLWSYVVGTTPKQTNIHDCGVFVCVFMDYLASLRPFDFQNLDMLYFRVAIGLQLIQEKVIYIDE